MALSGINKIAVYEPVSKTVVQLNKIASDGNFDAPVQTVEDSTGAGRYAGIDASFDCNVYDATGYDQLKIWMQQQTPLRLVASGVDENVLWYQDSVIVVKRVYLPQVGKLNGFNIKIAYKGGTSGIKAISNLILGNSLWNDANLDGKVDSLSFPAGLYNSSFSNDEQILTSGGAENKVITALVEFPIAGANIESSFDSALNQNTINAASLQALDKDQNILTQVSLVGGADSILTPSGTYYLKYLIDITFGVVGNVTKFTVPRGVNY